MSYSATPGYWYLVPVASLVALISAFFFYKSMM
jgi:hypothetical protein